jgi:tyrosinase
MFANADIPVSRRVVVLGAGAAITEVTLGGWTSGRADTRPKRCNVTSDAGKAMLQLYKRAIQQMSARPTHDPLSWQFQANIHDYPRAEPTSQIFALDAAKTPEERAKIGQHHDLALGGTGKPGIWKTCSHFGYDEHFLTWHRMYLFFFERIVEKTVGVPFALPYWDYSANQNSRRLLPEEFRNPTDSGKPNPLYFAARTKEFLPGGNGFSRDTDIVYSDAWRERLFLPSVRSDGFNEMLERSPHDAVHAAVGTVRGMGDTPMAARDPVFWVHHANVDRLWESWRQPAQDGTSSRDPVQGDEDWKKYLKFAFADPNGERVEMFVEDVLKQASKLNVQYDRLEPGPPVAMGVAAEAETSEHPTTLSKRAPSTQPKITARDVPVTVVMQPADSPIAMGFGAKPSTKYHLIIVVETSAPPGAAYDVFVRETAPGQGELFVKTFNLFGAAHGSAAHNDHSPIQRTWRADITELVKEGKVDPKKPGNVVFRARYADPEVPVTINEVRIEAR